MLELGIVLGVLVVLAWLAPSDASAANRSYALDGRHVDFFEETHGSDTFEVLEVVDHALPEGLSVHHVGPLVETGDPDFDAEVRVSGLQPAHIAALFGAENRRIVHAVFARGARLMSRRWLLSQRHCDGPVEPHAPELVAASRALAESWPTVSDDPCARLLEHLAHDPSPGHRHVCLHHLLEAPEPIRRQAIEQARTDPDVAVQVRVALLDGPSGLPVLLEAAASDEATTDRWRIAALDGVAQYGDETIRAALVQRILEAGPERADADLVAAALALDPGVPMPAAHILDPWLSPFTSVAAHRARVIEWLTGHGTDGLPHIRQTLEGETEPLAVRAAVDALGVVGTADDLARLDALRPGRLRVDGESRDLRRAIDDAVAAIRQRRTDETGSLSLADGDSADGRLSIEAAEARKS